MWRQYLHLFISLFLEGVSNFNKIHKCTSWNKIKKIFTKHKSQRKKWHPLKNNQMYSSIGPNPTSIHALKVNNKNARAQCEVCLKVKWRHQSDVNNIFLLLTLNSNVSIVNFEQANVSWQNSLILPLCVKGFKGNYLTYCLNSLAKILL